MTSTPSPDAAREAARRRDGKFGTQERAEGDVDLLADDAASGCCDECSGTGNSADGPCWDCRGSGHTHPSDHTCAGGEKPTETTSGHLIEPGDVLIVDGEERTVHETFTVVHSSHSHEGAGLERIVAFESFDREPDGSPTAILESSFDVHETFTRLADTRPAYERLDYGAEGSMQTAEPYQHLSLETSNRRARQMISEVRDGWTDLNPPYQRGSVWGLTQRQNLIRSIRQGIPIPAVYINDRTSPDWVRANGSDTRDTGVGMYAVVDGKQRIETMMAWYDSEFGVPASWFDPEHVESTFETADGPYVTMSHLTEVGARLFDNRAMLPVTTAHVATVEEEAALYLIVNGAGTEQTEADMENAARVASGD